MPKVYESFITAGRSPSQWIDGLILSFKESLQIALHSRKEVVGFNNRHLLSLTLLCTSWL